MKFNSNLKISSGQEKELTTVAKLNSKRFKLILEIYKDFNEFLNKIEVPNVFWAGSALGAHLYSDFIPWDDDIDIAIPHSSRKKVIAEFSNFMDPKYKLVCHETGPWCFPFMKVINTEYEIDSPNSDLPEYSRYLWIDVTSVTTTNKKKVPLGILLGGHILFARNATQGKLINLFKLPIKLIPQRLITWNMDRIMLKQKDGNRSLELLQFHRWTTAKIDFTNRVYLDFHDIKVPVTPNYLEHFKAEFPGSNIYKVPEKIETHIYKIKGLDY